MFGIGKISNLRIGWKLGLTAGLGVLLVLAMIGNQIIGSRNTREGIFNIERNDLNALLAVNMKASLRGIQIGMRDVRLATTPEEIKKAFDYATERYNSAAKFADSLVERVRAPEQQERANKAHAFLEQYRSGGKEMVELKTELLALQSKGSSAEAASRIAEINAQYAAIVRDRAQPASTQLDALGNEMEEFAKARAADNSALVASELTFIDRLALGLGTFVVLVLIASVFFSIFTIARPVQALTGGM